MIMFWKGTKYMIYKEFNIADVLLYRMKFLFIFIFGDDFIGFFIWMNYYFIFWLKKYFHSTSTEAYLYVIQSYI